jgi:hypothetical protein
MKLTHLFILLTISNIALAQDISDTTRKNALTEVTIVASNRKLNQVLEETQMGKVDLPVSMLAKAPAIGGESDVIKSLQLTPGVKRGGEGTIGMYVRGGGNDENLILLDGAPVYNAGHLLGFFSVFNTATLKDVQLYKSSFPVQYGGRLSSVLDVKSKEGSLTDYKASGSIGLIASSLTLQGPLVKDKLSIMVSGRRTYIDKVFSYIPYHFYDLNSKLTFVANSSNRLYLSAYQGNDVLKMSPSSRDTAGSEGQLKSGMKLGNKAMTLRWNHMFRENRFSSDLTALYTNFNYNIDGSMNDNEISMRSAIRDLGIKGEIKSYATGNHKAVAGFSIINHYFNPNIVNSKGVLVERFGNSTGKELHNNEAALYLNDDYRITEDWQLNAGIRLSGDFVETKTYVNAEPRLALRYRINERSALKVSYSRMTQYMHLVSSSSLALPTDLWYPVTAAIKPGIADQVSTGYYYNIPSAGISLSGEVYYKWLQNLVEYKEGALLILNDDYEKELVHGKGRSYGIELFASKTTGKFTGWLGYSLSYAHRQFDSLNKGKEYFAKYDRRHDVSFVGMYDLSKHWAFSTSVLYATGSPFTGQVNQYVVPKPDFTGFEIMPAYTNRNELRMSASFRIDLDVQYKFSIGKRVRGDAHLSVYNLLNRTQPNSVKRVWDESKAEYKYQQQGLFGIVPTATLNFNL